MELTYQLIKDIYNKEKKQNQTLQYSNHGKKNLCVTEYMFMKFRKNKRNRKVERNILRKTTIKKQ